MDIHIAYSDNGHWHIEFNGPVMPLSAIISSKLTRSLSRAVTNLANLTVEQAIRVKSPQFVSPVSSIAVSYTHLDGDAKPKLPATGDPTALSAYAVGSTGLVALAAAFIDGLRKRRSGLYGRLDI